jgi:hypothetical protein
MKFMVSRLGYGLVALIALAACGRPAVTTGVADASVAQTEGPQTGAPIAQSHGGPVKDHVSFVDHLRGKGLTVEIAGAVEQPFLRAKGTTLRLSGDGIQQPAEMQSYNYDDTDLGTNGVKAAAEDARQIGPDGNPPTSMITWVAPPHFFHKERVIVLYVGSDPAVLKLLTEALGPQFAGR